MKELTRISLFATALAALLTTTAHAADSGFYAVASLGAGEEDPKSRGTLVGTPQGLIEVQPDSVKSDDGGLAWGVGLGYRINTHVSGELEYMDFGATDVDEHYTLQGLPPPFPSQLDVLYSSKLTGLAVSVLGTLPLGHDFELFGRGGVLFASREYSQNGTIRLQDGDQKYADEVWIAGVGGSWSFATRWTARAEFLQSGTFAKTIATGDTKFRRVTLSLLYRF